MSQLQRSKNSLSQNIEELKKQIDEETNVRETIFLTAQHVPAFMWNQFLLLICLWHLLLSVKECLGSCPAILLREQYDEEQEGKSEPQCTLSKANAEVT